MTSSCQTAFTPSTKISLFTFQHHFSLSLQSGERHRSGVIFPDCQISNFHFFFSSGLGTVHDILKQHNFSFFLYFAILLVTDLATPITCQHLSIFCFDYCQKFFFRIFNSFSPDILIFTLLGNYIWLLNFLVNPSCTATDEYCYKSPFPGWRHRLLRNCNRCTARRHISQISLYHLSRLHAENIYW